MEGRHGQADTQKTRKKRPEDRKERERQTERERGKKNEPVL
jgi:hypothetical protein